MITVFSIQKFSLCSKIKTQALRKELVHFIFEHNEFGKQTADTSNSSQTKECSNAH